MNTPARELLPERYEDTASSQDCYGKLLRMLVPKASAIALYGPDAGTLWASAHGRDMGVLDGLVAERCNASALTTTAPIDGCLVAMDSGDAAYLSPLYDSNACLLGVLAVVVPDPAAAPRPYSFIHGVIAPVLECLQRDLLFQRRLGEIRKADDSPQRDLELLAYLAEDEQADADPAGALGRLAERCLGHFNAEICALIVPGKSLQIVRNTRHSDLLGIDILARTQRSLIAMAQLHGKPFTVNRLPRGRPDSAPQPQVPFKILSCPVRDRVNSVQGILALFAAPDAPDFEESQGRVLSLVARRVTALMHAGHDELTGALTLGAFKQVVLQAAATPTEHSMLLVNIDRMHVVNDRFGHEAGDEVLVRVADLARECVRPAGELCRLPGDQFALFLPGHDLEQARSVAEKLLRLVAQLSFLREDHTMQLSLSIGAAIVPLSKDPADEALAAAEVACRIAKDRGRGRVECYQEQDLSIIRRRTDITMFGELNDALTGNEFLLYAQPLQCTRTGRLHGLEILLRLPDRNGATLAPDRFLSSAERYHLMPSIDRWVVDNTLRRLARVAEHIGALNLQVFINLSGQSLGDKDFSQFLVARISAAEVPTSCLCFEITESAAISKLSLASELIARVRSLGGQFALDDFGTGLSSFAYLQSLPVSIVKIDGAFVRELGESRASTSMVTAIVQVARVMRLKTVAEYVENELIRSRLAALGVDFAQGYHIGRPQPLDDLLATLPALPLPSADLPQAEVSYDEEIVLSREISLLD
jgi:diguanylate cyclase (GGDEF)-like protein